MQLNLYETVLQWAADNRINAAPKDIAELLDKLEAVKTSHNSNYTKLPPPCPDWLKGGMCKNTGKVCWGCQ